MRWIGPPREETQRDAILAWFSRARISPVLTAHPTEVLLLSLFEVECLHGMGDSAANGGSLFSDETGVDGLGEYLAAPISVVTGSCVGVPGEDDDADLVLKFQVLTQVRIRRRAHFLGSLQAVGK